MTEQHPAAIACGDNIAVTITKTLPFGALVESADGTAGLARDLRDGAVGDLVTIRVDSVDDVDEPFHPMTTTGSPGSTPTSTPQEPTGRPSSTAPTPPGGTT